MKNTGFTDDVRHGVRRRRGIPAWVAYPLLGALLAVLFIVSGPALRVFTGGTVFGVRVVRPPFGGRTAFTVLVLGLDQPDKLFPEHGRRSDTMLLARVDLMTRAVVGLSIPRDTRVRLRPDGPWAKINAAYTEGGAMGAVDVVSAITGVMPDYYVIVDTASTERLVNLVGGVQVDVDKRMKYDDNWQDLHIDLRPGEQTLDGRQAVGYLRFRHDATGDIARMGRQQKFLTALSKTLVEPANLPRLPLVIREMHNMVDTDMRDDDLLYLANQMKDTSADTMEFHSLSGESRTIRGISYFLPYGNKMREQVEEMFPGVVPPADPPVDTLR